jgi:hypothetical protein
MKFTILILILLASMWLLPGCGNSNDNYYQGLLDDLQKQVPFKIIIPSYFPPGMPRDLRQIQSPAQDPEKKPQILLRYEDGGLDHSMIITESYWEYNFSPQTSFMIEGIQINKESGYFISGVKNISYDYGWYLNGVTFDVKITGYDDMTCRKVISSMITQNNTLQSKP